MDNYIEQANEFLSATATRLDLRLLGTFKHFIDDSEDRDVYEVTLTNTKHTYIFRFGDSINNTKKRLTSRQRHILKNSDRWVKPTAYDILACLSPYEVGTFNDFCDNYGYNNDSLKHFETYRNVCDEYENLRKLFNNEQLELLNEVQ